MITAVKFPRRRGPRPYTTFLLRPAENHWARQPGGWLRCGRSMGSSSSCWWTAPSPWQQRHSFTLLGARGKESRMLSGRAHRSDAARGKMKASHTGELDNTHLPFEYRTCVRNAHILFDIFEEEGEAQEKSLPNFANSASPNSRQYNSATRVRLSPTARLTLIQQLSVLNRQHNTPAKHCRLQVVAHRVWITHPRKNHLLLYFGRCDHKKNQTPGKNKLAIEKLNQLTLPQRPQLTNQPYRSRNYATFAPSVASSTLSSVIKPHCFKMKMEY
jgi:hypothetical protein